MSGGGLAERFERAYAADPDPWRYETSDYERRKYAATLAAVPEGTIDRALELGCSIGVFTSRLQPRCRELVATDLSARAVRAARERLRRLGRAEGVLIERRDLREGLPPGRFDLIVCSEILYYWRPDEALSCLRRIERALVPGGSFVAVHWRGVDPTAPSDGEAVHRLLSARTGLAHLDSRHDPSYLLDRWERPE